MSESYHQYNVKLHEAMTMYLSQSVRVWNVSGLHVKAEELPENATVSMTYVVKFPEGNIQLKILWTIKGNLMTYTSLVADVSALEELKDKFPKLFELEGTLYAFA